MIGLAKRAPHRWRDSIQWSGSPDAGTLFQRSAPARIETFAATHADGGVVPLAVHPLTLARNCGFDPEQ